MTSPGNDSNGSQTIPEKGEACSDEFNGLNLLTFTARYRESGDLSPKIETVEYSCSAVETRRVPLRAPCQPVRARALEASIMGKKSFLKGGKLPSFQGQEGDECKGEDGYEDWKGGFWCNCGGRNRHSRGYRLERSRKGGDRRCRCQGDRRCDC